MSETPEWTTPPDPTAYVGTEPFIGADATVRDFWAYALRDLKSNTTRGLIAEFLVARAVGTVRIPPDWHEYDVETPSGIRIEVKSSAYVQAWSQQRPSRIVFSGLKAKRWDAQAQYAAEATFNADVYVFAVQTAQTHDAYDPLDVAQWDFYVLPAAVISQIGQASLSLARIAAHTRPVTYSALGEAVATAAE